MKFIDAPRVKFNSLDKTDPMIMLRYINQDASAQENMVKKDRV
jgi:hypothetical protein